VTREQMAVFLQRAAGYAGKNATLGTAAAASVLAPFTDAGTVEGWASPAMPYNTERACSAAEPGAVLPPPASATRAEAATVLVRFLFGPSAT
jgi:hypothetical protein